MSLGSSPQKDDRFKISTDAFGAGTGGGTILIAIAQALPPESNLRVWLIYLAPTITVSISFIWSFLKTRFWEYLDYRNCKNAIKEAKKTLTDAENDPNTPEDHKKQIRKKVQQFEMIYLVKRQKKIR